MANQCLSPGAWRDCRPYKEAAESANAEAMNNNLSELDTTKCRYNKIVQVQADIEDIESCGSEMKIPRVSDESSGPLTPLPNFFSRHNEDRAGPSHVDAYGSSAPLSPRPIFMLRHNEDMAGPDIEDACSVGLSVDPRPTKGETKSNKKGGVKNKKPQ
ncbi:hypothetical protein Ancab_035551 [Ancistrocladus abbreviatus]